MKLTVLGSGSSVPSAKRSSSGFWLETSGGNILLDCSPMAVFRMAQEGLDWPNVDAVWISHFHLDHCGGLAPFLSNIKHMAGARDRMKPLRIFGGRGVRDLVAAFSAAGNYDLLEQRFAFEIIEVEPLEKFHILSGIEAVAMKTPHTDASHAVHIRDGEIALVYTADTGFDPAMATFANSVDLFLLECTFVRDKPVEKHLEMAEAMFLVRKAKPTQAMLTHFSPKWDEVRFDEEVAKFDPPCVVLEAVDGLRITIAK